MNRNRRVHPIALRLAIKGLAFTTLACLGIVAAPLDARADVSIGVNVSVGRPPPPLPVYEQPDIPGPGYLWTPGYWAWDPDIGDYYWVPGEWVMAPYEGALWTPGYWGWERDVYVFHIGYWSPHVGFYGGVDYGYGYTGNGYQGGYWGQDGFHYNQEVNHITNVHITNVYRKTVINNVTVNRVSYNGGRGGIQARPTPDEMAHAHERRTPPVAEQVHQRSLAQARPELRASVNHGHPPAAVAMALGAPRPMAGEKKAPEHVPATGAPHRQPGDQGMALPSAGFAHGHASSGAPNGERIDSGDHRPPHGDRERASPEPAMHADHGADVRGRPEGGPPRDELPAPRRGEPPVNAPPRVRGEEPHAEPARSGDHRPDRRPPQHKDDDSHQSR